MKPEAAIPTPLRVRLAPPRPGGKASSWWKRFLHWWHRRDLECACAMTTEVLRRKGRLQGEVSAFLEQTPSSPLVETMAILFLERLTSDRDPEVLQTAVAELSLFDVPWRVTV